MRRSAAQRPVRTAAQAHGRLGQLRRPPPPPKLSLTGIYAWFCEQPDEYAMSCLSPVPLPDLATKDDAGSYKEDVRSVKEDLRELKRDVARLDGKVDALAVRMDEKFDQIVELHYADLKERASERADDRRAASRRAWNLALVVPVEIVVLFAGAAAILEWLRV